MQTTFFNLADAGLQHAKQVIVTIGKSLVGDSIFEAEIQADDEKILSVACQLPTIDEQGIESVTNQSKKNTSTVKLFGFCKMDEKIFAIVEHFKMMHDELETSTLLKRWQLVQQVAALDFTELSGEQVSLEHLVVATQSDSTKWIFCTNKEQHASMNQNKFAQTVCQILFGTIQVGNVRTKIANFDLLVAALKNGTPVNIAEYLPIMKFDYAEELACRLFHYYMNPQYNEELIEYDLIPLLFDANTTEEKLYEKFCFMPTLLEQSALSTQPKDKCLAGICLLYGIFVTKNVEQGINMLKSSNSTYALHILGKYYAKEKDLKQAIAYFDQAANAHITQSLLAHARICTESEIIKSLVKQAVKENMSEPWQLLDLLRFEQYMEKSDIGAICFTLGTKFKMGNGCDVNWNKALELFTKGTDCGNAACTCEVALVTTNARQKLDLLFRAALHDNFHALYLLTNTMSQYTAESEHFAKFIQQLASTENKTATEQIVLGLAHCFGFSLPVNLPLGVSIIEEASKAGHLVAICILASCFEHGVGVSIDVSKAFDMFSQAAKHDFAIAQVELGRMYEQGIAANKDYAKAISYYNLAAQQNYCEAHYRLSLCYSKGIGVAVDEPTALRFLEQAANHKMPDAIFLLADKYMYGKGVRKDAVKAAHYCAEAAAMNFVPATDLLAYMNLKGIGVPQNTEKAIELFKVAAAKNFSLSLNTLGTCYEQGNGVAKDVNQAFQMYSKAAAKGYPASLFNMAACYMDGIGVAKNLTTAFHYAVDAVKHNYTPAHSLVGKMYLQGLGVAQDIPLAITCFETGAKLGHAGAIRNLAYCYEKGTGVVQDLHKALEYYEKCAQPGDAERVKKLIG